jgi:hypothetical protein
MKNTRKMTVGLLLSLTLLFLPQALPAADYETPPTLQARDYLPADLLKGKHHQVEPRVVNDGYMNRYTIKSDFGTFEARSTAMARIRIHEVGGIAKLKELSETEAFIDALAASTEKTVQSAVQIVKDPKGTIEGIPEGVGRMFKRMSQTADKVVDSAGETVSQGGGQGTEEKVVETGKELAGVNKAKRGLAKRVGVDPYSTNEVLQAELERLSWAAFSGGLVIRAAKSAIPFAGQITAVSGMVWDSNPADLEVAGRESLSKMGVPEKWIDAFYKVPHLTVTSRVIMVTLLEKMSGVEGLPEVVRLASNLRNREEAEFFVASCAMLEGYHRTRGPLRSILAGPVMPWGARGDGTVVLALAVDYLSWTKDIAAAAVRIADKVKADSNLQKTELWTAGALSPRSREELGALRWTLNEKAAGKLGLELSR